SRQSGCWASPRGWPWCPSQGEGTLPTAVRYCSRAARIGAQRLEFRVGQGEGREMPLADPVVCAHLDRAVAAEVLARAEEVSQRLAGRLGRGAGRDPRSPPAPPQGE